MAERISYYAIGALNTHPTSRETLLVVTALDPDEHAEELKRVVGSPPVRQLCVQLEQMTRATKVSIARGAESGFVENQRPARTRSEELRRLLSADGVPKEFREQLAQQLETERKIEHARRFELPPGPLAIRQIGRLRPEQAQELVTGREFAPVSQPVRLEQVPGEVHQYVLRVVHSGPTAIKVEHWARTPEGRDYIGGFNIAFVLPELRKIPWDQFGFEEANPGCRT